MTDNVVPLKEYIDAVTRAQSAAIEAKLAAGDRATDKAEQQLRERLAHMNEFRDQLRDQASKFTTRAELDLIREVVDKRATANAERIRDIELWKSNVQGRMFMLGAAVTLCSVAINYLIRMAFS